MSLPSREERLTGGYNRQQRSLHRELDGVLSAAEVERLDGVFARYERDYEPDRLTPALLHADLKPDHVMYDPVAQRVTGVLDWGDVSFGDPEFDLAIVSMFFGAPFLTRLLPHMPDRDPDEVVAKVRFFTTVRGLQDRLYEPYSSSKRSAYMS